MTRKYDESHITGFKRDLEKVRAKPTLYIGPTDDAGIFTVLRECMDNAVDEARAGRNNHIEVHVEADGSFWIRDRGVGIPVKKHKVMGISTLTHVLSNLQSSGKMQTDGAYKSAIGTHGVGIKASNALAEFFEVWTYRDDSGGWHYTRFEAGKEKVAVTKKKPKGSEKKGTIIHFKPDAKIFGKSKLRISQVATWMEMTSYMNAGLELILHYKGKTKKWKAKNGIKSYLDKRIEELNATPMSKKFVFHNTNTMEVVLSFTDVEGSQVEFFTNTVRNVEGGVHEDDVYKALYDSLKAITGGTEKAKKAAKAKKTKSRRSRTKASSGPQFTSADVRDGLLGIVNYKIDAPQFDSQTKEKLVDERVKGACYAEALKMFTDFFAVNAKLAKDLIARATLLRAKTASFLKDKKLVKNINAARKGMNAKLAGIKGNCPVNERELFLVEGDSAGGSAKQARDPSFQAVYPLKGKPLNVMETAQDKINNNDEIAGVLAAICVDTSGKAKKPEPMYGKIILLADADVDGSHINTLLMGVKYKFARNLIEDGHVYTVRSPLYKGNKGTEVFFGMTKEEVWEQAGSKVDITYLKGWGEVSPEDLGIAMDPAKRTLIRIKASDKKGNAEFERLLGKKPEFRKQLLGVI